MRDFGVRQSVQMPSHRRGRFVNPGWLVVFGLICVLSSGCSRKTYWYHLDTTLTEAEQDCRECYRRAQTEAAEASGSQRFDRTQAQEEGADEQWFYAYQDWRFRRCMKRRGYRLTPDRELKAPLRKRVLHMGSVQSLRIAGH